MRASAFPAEDPNSIKEPNQLIDYYLWMLSEKSISSSKIYIEFGDKI